MIWGAPWRGKVRDEAAGRSKTSNTASVPAQVPAKDGIVFSERADRVPETRGSEPDWFDRGTDSIPQQAHNDRAKAGELESVVRGLREGRRPTSHRSDPWRALGRRP